MPTGHYIKFIESEPEGDSPQVKFGGQPDWIDKPTWPLSRSTAKPMLFIGQIDLSLIDGYEGKPTSGYLFIADDSDEYIDGTWEPDGGENCLLLQPGNICSVDTADHKGGPTLYKMVQIPGEPRLQPRPALLYAELEVREDDAFIPEDALFEQEDLGEAFKEKHSGNKIGGTPAFLQGDEIPEEDADSWALALQLAAADVPFYVNFGDAGIGYAFVKKDGTKARFLWQCG